MLFSLPDGTIQGITGYAFEMFDSAKVYIFLALGVGLGLIILGIIYDLFFSFGSSVKKEARRRIKQDEEEEEENEFQEAVDETITEMLLED
jgi:hypothetical protein